MSSEKKFSSWLVVSDIDNTLNNKLRCTPQNNLDAVEHFVSDLGGNFTLASARNVQSLTPHYKRLPCTPAPAIVLNGAGIYDFSKEKMIWFNPVPDSAEEIVRKAMVKFPLLEIGVFTDDMIYLVRPRVLSVIMMALDSLNHRKCRVLDEVPKGRWGKVIFYCYPQMKKRVKNYVLSLLSEELACIDTTVFSFDIVNSTTNKGNAVSALAEIIGVPEDNICAIGDYYNDLDMLRTVRHPACCAQAPEELHNICEYHACHCNDGAVADFLEYIEKNY